MEFEVRCALREGRIVPRWALYAVEVHRGHLIVEERRDQLLTRSCRVARLIAADQHKQPTIQLFDPILAYASIDMLVLIGSEQIETTSGSRSFAQQWVCSAASR